jgi:excisionase family DNA binding protein
MSDSAMLEFTETGFPETVTPTEEDARIAAESSRSLARINANRKRQNVTVRIQSDGDGEESVIIPQAAFRMLMDILTEMSRGNAVTFMPIHAELTTQQAADILNVSRPFLVKLLEEKTIPFKMVGSHRRVRFDDLVRYKRNIDQARQRTLEELAAQAQEFDMGY